MSNRKTFKDLDRFELTRRRPKQKRKTTESLGSSQYLQKKARLDVDDQVQAGSACSDSKGMKGEVTEGSLSIQNNASDLPVIQEQLQDDDNLVNYSFTIPNHQARHVPSTISEFVIPGKPCKLHVSEIPEKPQGQADFKSLRLVDSVTILDNASVIPKLSSILADMQSLDHAALKSSTVSCLTEDGYFLLLVSMFGIVQTLSLISANNLVPRNFPTRSKYICNIAKASVDQNDSTKSEKLNIECTELVLNFIERNEFFKEIHCLTDDILWKATYEHKEPHNMFIVPPVDYCVECGGDTHFKRISQCTVYTLDKGPVPALKASFRCKQCEIHYDSDGYYTQAEGKRIYPATVPRSLVRSSKYVLFSEDTFEVICESSNHAFVSSEAFAEIYNTVYNDEHPKASKFHQWLEFMSDLKQSSMNVDPALHHVVQESIKASNMTGNGIESDPLSEHAKVVVGGLLTESEEIHLMEHETAQERLSDKQRKLCGSQLHMTRKNVMNVVFSGEVVNELRERGITNTTTFSANKSREDVMKDIDRLRRSEIYHHPPEDCSEECRRRGCKNLRVIDSCWKLCIPHCMFVVQTEVKGYPLISFPNVCTREPQSNSVFCNAHHKLLEDNGIPTKKEDFLKHLGCSASPKSASDIKQVDIEMMKFATSLYTKNSSAKSLGESAVSFQGTNEMVTNMQEHDDDVLNEKTKEGECNKDTGEKARLRQRSRGHFLSTTGGGHILYFDPIFKSESPSQVFMQVIRTIYLELKDIPKDEQDVALEQYVLCYDNMCHLDSLKASKAELPLPEPFNHLWQKIKKIIDRLHLSNHKNSKCQENYNPDKILPPGYNTMAAEQTFAWFSRYKKIVNSMTQTHHLFFLHRMIKRRNKYTAKCRKLGKQPLLPGINKRLSYKSAPSAL